MIKFDLHIHSNKSEYKEEKDIVAESTVENIEVLLSKLNDNNVPLFSITDHNRFNTELYEAIDKILSEENRKYQNIKSVLAGVEFDVKMEETMKKCHIITIFDTKNDSENYDKIKKAIDNDKLTEKDDYYSKERYENILKEIGLSTILIACQRKSIHNHNGKHSSISDSVTDVEEVIQIGYIQALEYQKPKVEGILKNNLKDIPTHISLMSGSDCHEWSAYPYHDSKNQNLEFYHSKAKMLPTFKGLLMAVTSPETRFNCKENKNTVFIDGFSINNTTIPLVNGINTIIGENGSGKSTILKLLTHNKKEQHVKDIIKVNELNVLTNFDVTKIKYIEQGDIIKKFNNRILFTDDTENNFKEIDDQRFKSAYEKYSKDLKVAIKAQIEKETAMNALEDNTLVFEVGLIDKSYYVNCINETIDSKNPHEEHKIKLQNIINNLEEVSKTSYFNKYNKNLQNALDKLNKVFTEVKKEWSAVDIEIRIKNIIFSCVDDYSRKISSNSNSKDQDIQQYKTKVMDFAETIAQAIIKSNKNIDLPKEPEILSGFSSNPKRGFYFNREAKYNNVPMFDMFFEKMFVSKYRDIDKLKEIKSLETFANAIFGCSNICDIESKWNENYSKFILEATSVNDYITDGVNKQIGSTLGEMSLSYYKYSTQENDDWNILVVDQPEDNISNNNISKRLIDYFNSIRSTKQLIFVTHNPLLVVNLDSDNVIYVTNKDKHLAIRNGCLEYENNDCNILDIVALNMDGGRDTIEKRLKVYGQSNKIKNGFQ